MNRRRIALNDIENHALAGGRADRVQQFAGVGFIDNGHIRRRAACVGLVGPAHAHTLTGRGAEGDELAICAPAAADGKIAALREAADEGLEAFGRAFLQAMGEQPGLAALRRVPRRGRRADYRRYTTLYINIAKIICHGFGRVLDSAAANDDRVLRSSQRM